MSMVVTAGDVAERVRLTEQVIRDELGRAGRVDRRLGAAMTYAVFPGGKRWRPLLTLIAAELTSGDWRRAVNAAAAIELLHCCSLVFDDLPCMDDSPVRRGRPALHRRFGDDHAILAGIGLLTTAYGLLARTPKPRQAIRLASRYLGPTFMLAGQAIDLRSGRRGSLPMATADPVQVSELRNRKTSGLIILALLVGALHGSLSRKQARALSMVGKELGNAFQIADDMVDNDRHNEQTRPAITGVRTNPIAGVTRIRNHVEQAIALLHGAFALSDPRNELTATVRRLFAQFTTDIK